MTAILATIDELRARVTEKGPWFDVPSDARPTLCRSCGAAVYFITTPAGKPMPVDVLVKGGRLPFPSGHPIDNAGKPTTVPPHEGRGVSHFATCPTAAQHRGRRHG